jgi:hypothetical protein
MRKHAHLLGVAAVGVVACVGFATGLRDTDTFHLLAMGRAIVRGGGFPATEPFLFPFAGAPTGASPSWLASVLFYVTHSALGPAGPVLLAAAVCGAVLALLLADALRDGPPSLAGVAAALVPLALAFLVLRPRVTARPEIFGYAGAALTCFALRELSAGRRRLVIALPVVVALWGCLHQSALVAIALLAAYAACGAAARTLRRLRPATLPEPPPRAAILAAVAAAAAGLVALAIVPSGLAQLAGAARLVASQLGVGAPAPVASGVSALSIMKHMIVELAPMAADDWRGPLGALLALTALGTVLSWRGAAAWELVAIAGAVAAAATTRRFMALAAVVAAPVAARQLAAAARWAEARLRATRWLAVTAGGAAVVATAAVAWRDPDLRPGLAVVEQGLPVAAARYLAGLDPRGRVYDTFQLGGYLEWTLDRPVFQDGRALLHAEDTAAAFIDTSHYDRFAALDGRYRFDALVLQVPQFDAEVAAGLAQVSANRDWAAPRDLWALVAFDDGGLLYLRRDGAYASRIASDEYRFAMPANPFPSARMLDAAFAAGLTADLERAVRERPASQLSRLQLGLALLSTRRPGEAEAVLLPALGGAPGLDFSILAALGEAAEWRGELPLAAAR